MEYKIPLWDHQLDAINKSRQLQDMALFWEMGTGKTAAMINILRHKFAERDGIVPTLIFAPLVVLNNWRNEFAMHSNIDPSKILVLNESGNKRLKQFKEAIVKDHQIIVITNYHSTQMTSLYHAFLTWKPQILVCDESHLCKNHKAKRAVAVAEIADNAINRYLLTGTPILNCGTDVYQQMRILDGYLGKESTFGRSYWAFKNRYFYDANAHMPRQRHFPNWKPRIDTYKIFNTLLYKKATRIVKKDCLDLPPLVKEQIHVSMGPEQAKAYKQMKQDFVAFLEADHPEMPKVAVATQAMTKALRLQQIVSGYLPVEKGTPHQFEKNPRNDALKELLETLTPQHKVIVWACFHENYSQIKKVCDKLKIKYSELHGLIRNPKLKDENLDKFRNDPDTRVMIANQSAGGIGVNMVEASYSIYYSRGFSLGDDQQSEARNYRGGSEIHDRVTRIDLVCDDSIDKSVLTALSDKKNISELILDWKDQV